MLTWIPDARSERKLRLFGCACVRRLWDMHPPVLLDRDRAIVQVTERYLEGLASPEIQELFQRETYDRHSNLNFEIDSRASFSASTWSTAAALLVSGASRRAIDGSVLTNGLFSPAWNRQLAENCHLLRCLFGNPFRPVAVDPQWLTSTVTQLAQGIYDDRAFDRLPILADALQDAGCDNDDVLNHCRDTGPHARGCWVVDLVLGKT